MHPELRLAPTRTNFCNRASLRNITESRRAFPKPRNATGPGSPRSMTKPLIRSIRTSAFCGQQNTRPDFGSRFFVVMPSLAISLHQFASSARQNAEPLATMPLTSLKRSSMSEPILCRSGQSKSFDCQPETHSVNHENVRYSLR